MIGKVLHSYRVMNEISLRDLGKQLGISAATLMRLEKGNNIDAQSMFKVMQWLFGNAKGGK